MTAVALERWLSGGGALLPLWRAILWAFAGYLLILGVAVLARPGAARRFLALFAADWRSNLLEAVLRALVGIAFLAAASTTRAPEVGRLLGLFLFATAVLIGVSPRLHARFARPATRFAYAIFPLFGAIAVALSGLVAWYIL